MSGSLWRAFAVSITTVLVGGLFTISPAQAADGITINVVVTNDFHGQIDDNLVQWAGTVEQLLGDAPSGSSLFLSAGDNVGKSAPASALEHDNPTLDVLNLLGLNATAVGNHEFDQGYDDLVNHIEQRANFPILGANVTKADGSPALPASAMFTVSGLRVAVIGAVTDTTPELTPPDGIAGLTFGDPVTAINNEVARLKALPEDQKPQLILATVHDGAPWGTWELNQAMEQSSFFTHLINDTSPDVAAIITGHTHNTYVFNAPIPGDPSRTRPVIQTGYYGHNVGQITLTVDPSTDAVTAYTARDVPRVTTSDADLISTYPVLAQVAQIRDDAVANAAAHTVAQEAAEQAYDTAVANSNDAYAAAQDAQTKYQAGVTAAQDAYGPASDLKTKYEAAVSTGKDAYTNAATIKSQYDAAVAAGKDAYANAATIKTKYDAAVASGKASYATAADLKTQYDAAVAAGKDDYNNAAALKSQYLVLAASGDPTVTDQLTALVTQYNAAIAAGNDAYASAAALQPDYNAAMSAANDSYASAAAIKPNYDSAISSGASSYAAAVAIKTDYDAAIQTAKDSYATAANLVPSYQQAIAAGKDSYATATALVPTYQTAVASGNSSYTAASALVPSYQAAITAGNAAYAQAAAIKPDYDAAVATWKTALATVDTLKSAFEAAVATLNSALATVDSTKETLLGLLGFTEPAAGD